ncbi:MAG: MBL fold metallo-hydrolase [Acidobacteriota bacterium]|nr:MBL fold metallo-hydrolase [Acidobacteriota bacterium]
MATVRKTARRLTHRAGEDGNELRIRMYRVGFGDFFLMTVPSDDGPQHILIDCGVTNGRTGKGDIGTIKAAVEHMAEVTGKKLALIIVSHRHQDHIIGFSRSAETFKDFQVDAIWMSAWETEYDPNEKKEKKKSKIAELQDELTNLAMGIQQHLAMGGKDEPERDEILAMVENATGIAHDDFAATGGEEKKKGKGGGTNAASLEFLKNGLGVEPQYLAKGDKPKLPAALKAAGLTAEILGPPPVEEESFDFMKLMDLAKHTGQYLGETGNGGTKKFLPFGDSSVGAASDYGKGEQDYKRAFREFGRFDSEAPEKLLEEVVRKSQPDMLFTAAKTLDDFLNNQSLVVLFTFRGKKLLFAGDAQGGNWEYWMFGGAPNKSPSLDDLHQESRTILGNLDFYKVGHHGSTNATPIAAVEAMGGKFFSMCSTQADSFGSIKNESEVPRIPLIEALSKKSKLVRSDHIPVTVEGSEVPAVEDAPARLPKPVRGRIEQGSIYIDYFPESA